MSYLTVIVLTSFSGCHRIEKEFIKDVSLSTKPIPDELCRGIIDYKLMISTIKEQLLQNT